MGVFRDLFRLTKAGLEQTVRLEENLLVTKNGPVIFTRHPFDEEALG